jgi:hypothetical protein
MSLLCIRHALPRAWACAGRRPRDGAEHRLYGPVFRVVALSMVRGQGAGNVLVAAIR